VALLNSNAVRKYGTNREIKNVCPKLEKNVNETAKERSRLSCLTNARYVIKNL
jgi:hypothetical protein